jgi:membrane-associated protease RseP (regulator of RpoE activity)
MRTFTFLALTGSVATAAGAQQSRQPCRGCSAAEARAAVEARAAQIDSNRVRGLNPGEIERVAAQLLTLRQFQTQAQQALNSLVSGQNAQITRAQAEMATKRLREQIDAAARDASQLRTQLLSMCNRNAKPQGYMGITFSATMSAGEAPGVEIYRFAENPTVETVEPGSPAEQAGVAKGDEIILIGGRRVMGNDIVFTQLLRPGNRLPIRVRRDGDEKDVVLVVGERPASLDNGCPFLDARIMAAIGDQLTVSPLRVGTGGIARPGANSVYGRVRVVAPPEPGAPSTPRAAEGGIVTVAPAPMVPSLTIPAPAVAGERAPTRSGFVFTTTTASPMVIAGATIVRTNADLRETFGVQNGVLVLDVARGTPAYASGLRGGDIIVGVGRVNNINNPLTIQRAIDSADDAEVTLRVIRKKKAQSIVLRWQ